MHVSKLAHTNNKGRTHWVWHSKVLQELCWLEQLAPMIKGTYIYLFPTVIKKWFSAALNIQNRSRLTARTKKCNSSHTPHDKQLSLETFLFLHRKVSPLCTSRNICFCQCIKSNICISDDWRLIRAEQILLRALTLPGKTTSVQAVLVCASSSQWDWG